MSVSFLVDLFLTMVVNPPEKKLVKHTSVQFLNFLNCLKKEIPYTLCCILISRSLQSYKCRLIFIVHAEQLQAPAASKGQMKSVFIYEIIGFPKNH